MKHVSLLKDKVYQLCLLKTQLSEKVDQLQANLESKTKTYNSLQKQYNDLKQKQVHNESIYIDIKKQVQSLIDELSPVPSSDQNYKKTQTNDKLERNPVKRPPLSDERKKDMESFFKEDSIYLLSDDD